MPGPGALPGARTTFEPLNAKKLERPAASDEPGIDYTPQCPGILTWWSHVLVEKRGESWRKRPTRGSKTFNRCHERICFRRNIRRTVWTKLAHSAIGRCPHEGTTLCLAAKAVETSLRPAIRVRISSTKRGRITNCAIRSTRSRRSSPILGSRSSFAGFTSNRKERSFGRDATGTEPANLTGDLGRLVRQPFPSP